MFESDGNSLVPRVRNEKALRPQDLHMIDKPTEGRKSSTDLDSPAANALHRRMYGYYQQEMERHYDNRREMATDHEFYDGHQYDEKELDTLADREQVPVTYNVIATTIDWVLGNEKRNRKDFKVLPRRKEHSEQARMKTDVLKYLSDVNDTEMHVSRSFKDAAVGGVGWLEDCVTDDNFGDIIETKWESWRNVLWDSFSVHDDLRDARYLFRSKWIDADFLAAWFPKREAVITMSISQAYQLGGMDRQDGDEHMDAQEDSEGDYGLLARETGYYRDRVRAIECWYRKVIPNRLFLKGGQFHNEPYDEYNVGHEIALKTGESEITGRPAMAMFHALMTPAGLLWHGPSPYQHNQFPFTPIWAYRRDKDRMPYGIVRRVRSIQRDINHRATKALHILNSNKTIMDEGAVPDVDKYLEEVNRPDSVIVKRQGKDLVIDADRGLDQSHLDMMSRDITLLQQVGGITDENMGRTTNAKSGIAIERRQDQGLLTTLGLYDNLRHARRQQGQKQLSLVEQYFTEPRVIRVTNARNSATFSQINSGDPTDEIARTKSDFVVGEMDWNVTLRQTYAEMLFDFAVQAAQFNPAIAMGMLDLIIELMDLPNGDEMVKRVRAVTGQSDPDADEPTPEEMQRQQAEAEAQERQIRMQLAEILAKEAEGKLKMAQAEKAGADTQKIASAISKEGIETLRASLEAALQAISAPGVVPVADEMLREAGFKGRTEQEDDAAVEEKAAQIEQLAAEGAAQQAPQVVQPDATDGDIQ